VLLTARREDKLTKVAERIRSAGGTAETLSADVTSTEDCERAVERCIERFGSIYSVYANAGYGFETPVHECLTDAPKDDRIRAIFETNFFGSLNAIRPALPRMIEAGAGHVLICSSSIGKFTVPRFGPYCASKAAQWHIARAMNAELRTKGVFVSSVHPIGTKTEFFDEAAKRSGGKSLTENTPDLFMQPAEKVAKAIVKCLRKPRAEVWTSTPVKLIAGVLTAAPNATDWLLHRMERGRTGE
jgi:short-subunit dehydrogenase